MRPGEWDQDGTPPEAFLLRRFAAMQAWYEHMPVRKPQFPADGRIQMFRRLDYGRLLRIHLLDKVSTPGGRKAVTESFVTEPDRPGVESA